MVGDGPMVICSIVMKGDVHTSFICINLSTTWERVDFDPTENYEEKSVLVG